MATYDRYSQFRQDGAIAVVPFGEVPAKNTDFFEVYERGKTRLDIFGWLIMQANPQYGSVEFEIPDRVTLRIPYPLSQSIQDYQASIDEHKRLYK